jgi:hypothetical protein
MTELTTKQATQIAIPSEFQGFTEEEALGGMSPIQEGYLKSFKYFLSRPSMKARFQITNNETDEVAWEGSKITGAVIYYGHEVLRLKKGHVESVGKNESDFTDEENEILAVSYDAINSKGNFEINGYGKYLTKEYAELQGKMRRLYLIMVIPGKEYGTGTELVAASFSITTIKSFNALRKLLKGYSLPLPIVKTEIFFSDAKSESGQEYDRIDFGLMKKEDGSVLFSHKSREGYLSSPLGKPLLDNIILTHKAAVENAERSGFGSSATEKEVVGATTVEEPAQPAGSQFGEWVDEVKTQFKGTIVDPDEMPFL